MFDQEPDRETHGECAAEIKRLREALEPFAKLVSHVPTEQLKGKDFFWNPAISGDEIARAREVLT